MSKIGVIHTSGGESAAREAYASMKARGFRASSVNAGIWIAEDGTRCRLEVETRDRSIYRIIEISSPADETP